MRSLKANASRSMLSDAGDTATSESIESRKRRDELGTRGRLLVIRDVLNAVSSAPTKEVLKPASAPSSRDALKAAGGAAVNATCDALAGV